MPSEKIWQSMRAAVAAVALVAATAGCASSRAVTAGGPTRRPDVAASLTGGPLPASTVRRLPRGAFYFLWGPVGPEENLWEVTPGGAERQLSHNPRGYEIDAFAASRAGIIVSDAQYNLDLLARWTRHGPVWMKPWPLKGRYLRGFDPDIAPDGEITYQTPPKAPSNAIWIRHSFTGPAKIIYRYPASFSAGSPVLGPRGQVALVVSGNYLPKNQKPAVLIISRDGAVRELRTGFQRFGYPAVWSQDAAALVIPPSRGAEKLFYPGGRQERLPSGWKALSWSPDGKRLLVLSRTSLGIWSLATGKVRVIGPVNVSSGLWQASWLNAPAPI